MRVLVASDKFKGCLTADQVSASIATGLRRVGVGSAVLPLADGGDGSVDAAVASGFQPRPVTVQGADGRGHEATIAIGPAATAVVEVANTCGLSTYGPNPLNALSASSYGFGQAIRAALEVGARRVILALGGSASTDGGVGMLAALGYQFADADGNTFLPVGGGSLADIYSIDDDTAIDLSDIDCVIASDVTNPLLGIDGAAHVFGPQKGASSNDIQRLDAGLHQLVDTLVRSGHPNASEWASAPGAGAAGGIGFAGAMLGATLVSGADYFLDLLRFDAHLSGVDLVITGEGRLDTQTLSGKLPVVVARRAYPIPTLAVVGANTLVGQPVPFGSVYAVADICDSMDSELTAAALDRIGAMIGENALKIRNDAPSRPE